MESAKGKAVYSLNIPRQLKKLGLTKDKYVRVTFRDGYVSGSCIDGSVFICQVLNSKEIKDMMTFKEPKHKLFCHCFRYPLLITVSDDWKLRVLNIDNDLKQKFSIPIGDIGDASPDMARKRGSGMFPSSKAGSGFLSRRGTTLGTSSPVPTTHTRAAQFILFNGEVLAVVSPDKLFLMKYTADGRNNSPTFLTIHLQGFSGVSKKLSKIDMKHNRILIGGPSQFLVYDINDGNRIYEGELPSKLAQTFFHIKMIGDTVVGATSSDFYVWSIRGRKDVDTGTNLISIPTKHPISHLYIDDHYIITGHVDGAIILWVRQTARMIKAFNRQKREAVETDEKKSESELSPFLSRTASSRSMTMGMTLERRVNKIVRWGDWVFVAYADCSLCVWDRRAEEELDGIDRPTRNWKLKEEVDNIFLDTEKGRMLLALKQPHKIRSDKGNEESQRIFWRTLKPKLEGFGVDPFKIQAYNMLEGSLQHKLTLCRDTNLQILRILSTNDKLEELAVEFGPNMEMVQRHLRELLANLKASAVDAIAADILPLDSMYMRMLQFQEKINSLDKGSMKRFLASISLRSALEHLCSSIHRDFQQFLASCRNLDIPSKNPTTTLWTNIKEEEDDVEEDDTASSGSFILSPRRKEAARKTITPAPEPDYSVDDNYAPLRKPDEEDIGVEPSADELGDEDDWNTSKAFFQHKRVEDDSDRRQALTTPSTGLGKPVEPTEEELKIAAMLVMDDNSPASYLWKIHFGENVFVVDRPAFMKALQTRFKLEVTEHQEKLIAHIIDNSNTGTVTKHKFGEWLKGFGPVERAVENTSLLLCEPWFHGFITHRETELLLEKEDVGTFLVRFSESRPGAFTLAFVHKHPDKGRQTLQIHIQNNPDDDEGNRFKVMQAGKGFKYFKSVPHVISSYSSFLKIPLNSTFLSQPWFFGDLTREESEELLHSAPNKQPGLFLVRFSQRTAFASSYIDEDGEVKHSSIIKGSTGYKTGTNSKVYSSLNELVSDYSSALKLPLSNTRVELYNLRELITLT